MEKCKEIVENKIPEFENALKEIDSLIVNVDAQAEAKKVIIKDDLYSVTPYDYLDYENTFKPQKNHYKYQKVYNKTYSNFAMTPVLFSTIQNQITLIDFKFNIKLPASEKNYVAKIYLNSNVIKTYNIGSLIEETTFSLTYNEQYYNTEFSNMLYVEIKQLQNLTESFATVYVENMSFELWGTNAFVLHLEKKYNVTCFNDTYFVTKSTGDKTYLLEKPINDIMEINEAEFVEISGAYGSSAQITFTSKQIGENFIFDKKILTSMGPNGEIKIQNLTDNNVIASDIMGSNYRVAECLPHKNASECVLEFAGVSTMWANYSSQSEYYKFTSALNFATASNITLLIQPGWFLPVLSPNGNINVYQNSIYLYAGMVGIGANLCQLNNGFISLCGVINGLQATGYYLNDSCDKIEVFANVFGKCVRSVAEKINEQWSVTERKVIGYYDFYFQGANNDYFIMVNGNLKYYKK